MAEVIRCANLEDLLTKWNEVRDKLALKGTFWGEGVFENLKATPRIQWFLYTDNRNGIAVRLYDQTFKNDHPEHYQDPQRDPWVILRGENLGPENGPCKAAMLKALRDQGYEAWTATKAPSNDPRNPESVNVWNADEKGRRQYFEDQFHNNAGQTGPESGPGPGSEKEPMNSLDTVVGLLHQFRQVILYGPPGTGKTRLARLAALAVLNGTPIPQKEEDVRVLLTGLKKEGRFELVVFHPAYEYEQFVGGIAPRLGKQGLEYEVKLGPFFNLCTWVRNNKRRAVLVIDEINRGNLPKLMGELVYALEYRDNDVTVPFEGHSLEVPQDLYIIGTMNSSDRSIGHIDAAIRGDSAAIRLDARGARTRRRGKVLERRWSGRLRQETRRPDG